MKKRLYIVDGHALCYRAYFAFIRNPLTNSRGQNTSAIFGFARMLLKLAAEQRPDYLAVAFDPPKKSFRFGLYPAYKANREKMPDDLRSQIDEIKEMLGRLGVPRIEEEDFEADDVLGTAAKRYASKDLEVVLVTGDKDAYQLVGENVRIYANKKGIADYEMYGPREVEGMLGVRPDQVPDFMALTGDASDNVPGVKGIGEKTAQKLIAAYGSLDNLYARIDEITGKQRDLLVRDREMAYLSRDLVTIRTDLPIAVPLDELRFTGIDRDCALSYFRDLEMNSVIRDFFPDNGTAATPARAEVAPGPGAKDYRIVRTREDLARMIDDIRAAGEVSMDTETTSLSPVDAELVGMSFSIAAGHGWYVPLLSRGMFGEEHPDPRDSLELLKPLLEDARVRKIGQNIKYDIIVLLNYGIVAGGIDFDTMVASYLLAPNERRHNLDDLAATHLSYRTITFKELVGTGKSAVPVEEVPLDRIAEYAVEDADIAGRLCALFRPRLAEDADLEKLFREVEMPLVPVLADIERAGVKIDANYFGKLERENREMLREVEERIYDAAEARFNINSTRELSQVLFDRLRLKPQRKTKTGLSTDIRVLESLRGSHPVIDHLIRYRTLSKLGNTYIEALPKLVSPKTGRIHTSYNQTVVATGRLSSSDPNLQNIPVRDEEGKRIRRGFVTEKGSVLVSADYSQIELRVAAHLSQDGGMMKAFRDGIDIHAMTASSVFGVPLDGVTSEMRRQAKVINFATIYGVSPFGLSQQAEIGVKEAAEFIRLYFQAFPGVREYLDRTIAFAREHGYVKTMLGRRRDIPDINSSTLFRREGAERMAINTPVQGTAADMIKIAMIQIGDALKNTRLKTRMIMQVHDELVFEVPEDELEKVKKIVAEKMEHALELSVPVRVDIGTGDNWEEAH